jgi:hypothetical protein
MYDGADLACDGRFGFVFHLHSVAYLGGVVVRLQLSWSS